MMRFREIKEVEKKKVRIEELNITVKAGSFEYMFNRACELAKEYYERELTNDEIGYLRAEARMLVLELEAGEKVVEPDIRFIENHSL